MTTQTMQGAVLPGGRQVELRTFSVPEPGHGQILLRMRASIICGSDIRAIYREHLGTGAEAYQGVIALANATFSSHLGTVTKFKWLSFVVGPATAWSKQTLQELNQKLLDELRKSITKCEGYRIDKTVSVTQMNVSVTIQYTGTKCGGADGEWVIESSGTQSGYGGTAEIGGPIMVELNPDTLQGTLDGTANFRASSPDHPMPVTQGRFTGTAEFVPQPAALELTVTGGSGNGYTYGFLDTGFLEPGTLTFPLETDFCDE